MLKKSIITLSLLLLFSVTITGCSEKEAPSQPERQPEQQILTPEPSSEPVSQPVVQPEKTAEEVDIDLTPFNNNMMYAEVMNMTLSPDEYNGKTIRLRGEFSSYSDMDSNGQPVPDSHHLLCIVYDTMGCCAQGVELLLKDPDTALADEGKEITVSGICNIYMDEYEFAVFELKDAVIE